MDTHTQQEQAPRVLLGAAVTRLMRIRSIYYELVAVAILGLRRHRHPAVRLALLPAGLAPGHRPPRRDLLDHRPVGLPRPPRRLPRRRPAVPARPPGPARAGRRVDHRLRRAVRHLALHAPAVDGGRCSSSSPTPPIAPLSISIFQTLAATAPPEMRGHLLRHVRRVRPGVRRLRRRHPARRHQLGRRRHDRAGPHRAGVRGRRCAAGHRVALRAPRHHPRHRGRARALRRGQAPPVGRRHPRPADPQPRLLLRHQPGAVRHQPRGGRRRRSSPCSAPTAPASRRCCAPSPGSSTPTAASIRLFGTDQHLPRARADHRHEHRAARRRQDDVPRPDRARQPADRRALLPPRLAAGPGRRSTRPSASSPSSSAASTTTPARCRAASSRCWRWPA